jgi:tape measure domain-containing protein
MATLRAIFRLTDSYSSAIDRITNKTVSATSNIEKASRSTDTLNKSFTSGGSAASALTSRLTALIGTVATFATLKKAMDISDEYTNTNSRLSLITSNLTQQKALQEQIFAAADRARGSYSTMADTVAKLGITSLSQFGNTDNIVKFTETMQKMFKIGGTGASSQSGAMLQLQQAIGLGKLQGQDLRILAEDAPLVETAIAKYMGKSTGEIKKLGEQGSITSQVLINSILDYSGTVDSKMSKMSYTWGDYWNKIKNGATKAFTGVFNDQSKILGSSDFKNTVNGIIGLFSVLAKAANQAITVISNVGGFITQNWSTIAPVLGTVVAGIIAFNIVSGISNLIIGISNGLQAVATARAALSAGATLAQAAAATTATGAQVGLNAAILACPLTWVLLIIIAVIGAIYLVVAIINKVTGQSISATGLIAGSILVVLSAVYNTLLGVINGAIQAVWSIFVYPFLALVEWVLNAANGGFNGFGGAVANLIGQIIGWFLSLGQVVTKIIDAIFGTNWTSGLESLKSSVTSWGKNDKAITITSGKNSAPTIGQRVDPSSAWSTGYKAGQGADSSISKALSTLTRAAPKTPKTTYNDKKDPTKVTGTGTNGAITVNIADQDLQYLRDLAEKDYVNKFSTAVLSPKINVSVSNATSTESNAELANRISTILNEQIATSAEGVYS